ncbi:hypothetical protein BDD12DRAFT_74022 [Trichophaea hybrida]|nr:hypothetical protein BDD12DRAFT_74022 [Trichophaea hybrida]
MLLPRLFCWGGALSYLLRISRPSSMLTRLPRAKFMLSPLGAPVEVPFGFLSTLPRSSGLHRGSMQVCFDASTPSLSVSIRSGCYSNWTVTLPVKEG